jgi:hypothetical protein
MTHKIASLAAVALLVFGCSRSNKMQRGQQQYDVVQEGSASGVTSTINGPGETPAPATDTNADTTTNFTLPTNPNPLGNSTAGTTTVGTLPSTTSYPSVPPRSRTSAPAVTDTAGSTAATMANQRPGTRPSEQTDTSMTNTDTSWPATDTAATDTTSAAPPGSSTKRKKGDGNNNDTIPPPPTDTTGTQG